MPLKITLKPYEKFILGRAVITNGDAKSVFVVENEVPILREKDILSLEAADTPCKKIYFAIQLMYVDNKNLPEHHKTFWELVKDVVEAAPSTKPILHDISENILNERYYQALKLTKKLIGYEREIINHVRSAN
ncbi:MAG: flagellar biosynthesis repressor FlbT [Desulfobacterales bacterium]|jgi:flagellar protein FlbT|nr:flagellar biosynthesis repressor FlbT [Desulfobacterales bacterium]MDD3080912.1 flagellar biosynthesis repressor FlbT [Desulfobacterales bacterium]MDD3952245.1 flagellar biosynthesis repressor FlbT [Desulfobacterales bacterium]MDY0377800.1 flagellar biosynthesis repressor FlbT [Desulfobacterales bacterium]